MFESRRERFLLGVVLVLMLIVLIDSMLVKPLQKYVDEANERITQLEEGIGRAKLLLETEPAKAQLTFSEQRIRLSNEQGQNEFRQYLESQAGPDVIKRSTPGSTADVPELDKLQQMTYELQLEGPMESLRMFLHNLDGSHELLRIDRLRVAHASMLLDDRQVSMTMTVSTIARKAEGL